MEITKQMYELAKEIVRNYERSNNPIQESSHKRIGSPTEFVSTKEQNELAKKMKATFEKDNYNNPFEDGEIMPCCGQRYCFSYAHMKFQKRNPKLKYRETKFNEGQVDYDSNSPNPSFVDYNGVRESIRQAKLAGLNHTHRRMSLATTEAIIKEGYTYHRDRLDTISW